MACNINMFAPNEGIKTYQICMCNILPYFYILGTYWVGFSAMHQQFILYGHSTFTELTHNYTFKLCSFFLCFIKSDLIGNLLALNKSYMSFYTYSYSSITYEF